MSNYSKKYILKLHREYQSLNDYSSKLIYFNILFKIIPYQFPSFTTDVSTIFDSQKIQNLIRTLLYERDRKNNLEKIYSFDNEKFVFSIYPNDSETSIFSNYILSYYLDGINLDEIIENEVESFIHKKARYNELIDKANQVIYEIKYLINISNQKSYQILFFNFFYKGFLANNNSQAQCLNSVYKFTEFYLYAQGILFSKYVIKLKYLFSASDNEDMLPTKVLSNCNILKRKVELLQNLGIIGFLMEKYASEFSSNLKQHVAEKVCVIIDQPNDEAGYILSLI